jgi:hypothetical protein
LQRLSDRANATDASSAALVTRKGGTASVGSNITSRSGGSTRSGSRCTRRRNSDDETDDDEEGISCIQIYTVKGRLLCLDEENNIVYEPQEDDNGQEIGVLKEIPSKYHTIFHNDKYYTVIKEIKIKNRNNILCCVLSDNLFDKKLNYIGKRIKLKNNEYNFDFIDEL